MTFDEVLSRFDVKSRRGNRAQAICPAHHDQQASLTISEGKKGILIYCHAGCKFKSILSKVGLEEKDLFLNSSTPKTQVRWKSYVEKRERRKIEAVYPYHSARTGDYLFTKLRLSGKKLLYGRLRDGKFFYGLDGKRRCDMDGVYGNLESLKSAISNRKTVFIPEGEKDVDTLTQRGYVAVTYGGTNDWQQAFSSLFVGARVCVLVDNDAPGINVAKKIQHDLKDVAADVCVVIPTPDIPHGDVTDFFENGGSDEEFEKMVEQSRKEKKMEAIQAVSDSLAWKIEYGRDGHEKSRRLIQSVRNFEIAMDRDPRISGKIGFDEFSRQTYLVGNVPWDDSIENFRAWSSFDDSALFSLLQSDYGLKNRQDYFDAIKNVSHQHRFHPVRDILDSLVWDGQEHIRHLLPDYLGAEDSEYVYQVWKLWMLGAVARIYRPGCKFDYTPILQGPQGVGKSSFLQLLALNDNWFNDSLDSLDSDRAAQSLTGSWIIELAELKSLARTAGGVDSVKRFLTSTQDKYRIPYERRADIFLRQCVFAGTTNREDFLQDETGNRRFLVIRVGVSEPKKNLFSENAMADIRAAWAEAVYIFKHENPVLTLPEKYRQEAKELQEQSMSDDGKAGLIERYLEGKSRVCAIEIWQQALMETGRPAKWQAGEINNIVAGISGWKKMRNPARFGEYGNQRGFQFVDTKPLQKKKNSSQQDCCEDGFKEIQDYEQQDIPFD